MKPTSLRERKRADTRLRIERSALRLFKRRGYDAVSVADIAAAADVAPRTFFRYFPAKEDVLFARDAEVADVIARALSERPAGEDPMTIVRAGCEAMAAWTEEHAELVRDRWAVIAGSPALAGRDAAKRARMDDAIAALLRDRLDTGAADPRPLLYARIGSACYDVAVAAWLAGAGTLTDELERALAALPGPA